MAGGHLQSNCLQWGCELLVAQFNSTVYGTKEHLCCEEALARRTHATLTVDNHHMELKFRLGMEYNVQPVPYCAC